MKNKIAIWGAGNFGQYIFEQLKKNNNVEIEYFVDKNPELKGKMIAGVEVIDPKTLLTGEEEINTVLVAFIGSKSLYKELTEYKGINLGFVKDDVLIQGLCLNANLYADGNIFWVKDVSKPLLENLETNVVDYCNLNCKGCSHFSNLYNKGDMVSFENYCRDLAQIATNVNVYRLNLLGGEVFLNNRLLEYLDYAKKIMPNTEIWIITNGLLLPKQQKEFWEYCAKNNIGIDISEYKPTSKIINQIISILEKYNIKYNIRDNKGDFGKNIDLLGRSNPNEAMLHCREHACHFFRKGKIYKCPFEALGNKFFEYFKQDIRMVGGTDIHNDQLDWDRLVYELENEPVKACVYCGEEVRYEWEISNNPAIEEWIIN